MLVFALGCVCQLPYYIERFLVKVLVTVGTEPMTSGS